MAGVYEADAALAKKPKGLGYITVEVTGRNPFYEKGTILNGHEFHYSYMSGSGKGDHSFRVLRGTGMGECRDGLVRWNTLGTYVHVHALGEPRWAAGLLARALSRAGERRLRNNADSAEQTLESPLRGSI
jgi:cobyrinic acid a,c-diamide synthase